MDLDKVSTLLLNELRSGKLGGISLETPTMVVAEIAALQRKQQEKAAARKDHRLARKARRKLAPTSH